MSNNRCIQLRIVKDSGTLKKMGYSSRLYPCCRLGRWKWLLLMFIHLWSQWTIFDGYFQQDMHMSPIIWSMTMSPLCSWGLQSPNLQVEFCEPTINMNKNLRNVSTPGWKYVMKNEGSSEVKGSQTFHWQSCLYILYLVMNSNPMMWPQVSVSLPPWSPSALLTRGFGQQQLVVPLVYFMLFPALLIPSETSFI